VKVRHFPGRSTGLKGGSATLVAFRWPLCLPTTFAGSPAISAPAMTIKQEATGVNLFAAIGA
jgi:hypothetical protein